MRLTTFGFEAEFEVNASAVIQRLHAMELAGDSTLHSYHCDCEYCEFGNDDGYPFRGQTDSSCSGEIISDILGPTQGSNVRSLYLMLAAAACEADAEPGLRSAFHVHVGIGDLTAHQKGDALWQYLRWEPVLQRLGGGRWTDQRSGMNTTVRECLSYVLTDWEIPMTVENIRGETPRRDVLDSLLSAHMGNDRHSNLNIAANRQPTWEFRLWNSTRSAWRMELFTGVSVALLDPGVVSALSELQPPERRRRPSSGLDNLTLAVSVGGHDHVAELINRQAAYLDNGAASAPSTLTAL